MNSEETSKLVASHLIRLQHERPQWPLNKQLPFVCTTNLGFSTTFPKTKAESDNVVVLNYICVTRSLKC